MQPIVRTDPSVIELDGGSASQRPSVSAARPYIMRLDSEHEPQLSALLCGLDKSSRINRFGHPASDIRVRGYAKGAVAGAAYMAGAFDAGLLIGVVEVFATCDGVAEVAFAIDAHWRRQGLGLALLEAATRWAEQAGVQGGREACTGRRREQAPGCAIQVRPIPRWRKIKTTAGREMNRDRWRLFERG
jgi:GNAT superfamily N-acetyltransferase